MTITTLTTARMYGLALLLTAAANCIAPICSRSSWLCGAFFVTTRTTTKTTKRRFHHEYFPSSPSSTTTFLYRTDQTNQHQQPQSQQQQKQGLVTSDIQPRTPMKQKQKQKHGSRNIGTALHETTQSSSSSLLHDISERIVSKLDVKEMTRTCKVTIGPVDVGSTTKRLGFIATQSISKGDVCLSMPYDTRYELRPDIAKDVVFSKYISDQYNSWSGDVGLIALMVLNEVCRASGTSTGIALPVRPKSIQDFMNEWICALPGPAEMSNFHPLLWSEEEQEILQSSTTNKIYKQLDDIEDDVAWLTENVFEKDRILFPETILWNGQTIQCYTLDGLKWAMSIALSRSFFLDGTIRLIPFMDMCNHSDDCSEEVQDGKMGPFRTTNGALLIASSNYNIGDEICCSYGPKSAADYLLEHGFVPDACWKNSVCEVTFEIDPNDRFYDDKLDILEYETYDQAPMDPVQSFDLVSTVGRDGDPDPAMIQFLRLSKLGKTDAFLLESIFRKDVWDFMSLPVSEQNEIDVINEVVETCQRIVKELEEGKEYLQQKLQNNNSNSKYDICNKLRESEIKALLRTMAYLEREKQAVDLKEYYQQRRLRDLGLDSTWAPDGDDEDIELGFDQKRKPGGADYDW